MIDLVDIESGPWDKVARKFRKGQSITKAEVRDLLKAGYPLPPDLNPLMLEILDGRFSFARAKSKPIPSVFTPRFIHNFVRDVECWIADTDTRPTEWDAETHREFDRLKQRTLFRRREKATANQSAICVVADALKISTRQVQTAITEHRESLQTKS
ncbi:MAG: hypothetical protein SH820_14880 [Xanthomonadales bacterium]|nr:hypothetical protein [Xanthomonadales bacterium]